MAIQSSQIGSNHKEDRLAFFKTCLWLMGFLDVAKNGNIFSSS